LGGPVVEGAAGPIVHCPAVRHRGISHAVAADTSATPSGAGRRTVKVSLQSSVADASPSGGRVLASHDEAGLFCAGPISHPGRARGQELVMSVVWIVVIVAVVVLLLLTLAVKIVKQYEKGVLFRLGKVIGIRDAGLTLIIPFVDVLNRVSLRIVTMPIQSQGIITRDNVSVDVSAVAYFRVVDAVKSVVAIENVGAAINQIAQTTLRKVVGQHTLDETLAETDRINVDIKTILDVATEDWGVEVTLVELKDIQLPDSMKRAMARQAEAEREKRAKIIAAEGEALAADALGSAADIMMAHPLALQLRNLQSLVEIGVDKNTTVVFPAPLMSTIGELGAFLARESGAATAVSPATPMTPVAPQPSTEINGRSPYEAG
jgi:regulator of protease activity HflC (stomatin/prohibitin superfamily)